jgi:hypothetical protein
MNNRQPYFKRFLLLYVLLATLTTGGIFFATTAGGDTTAPPSTYTKPIPRKPVSLVGTWHQTKGMPGVTMTAEVSGDGIQINMHFDRDNIGGIFWMGSFDTSDKTDQSFTVTSMPDPDAKKALKNSLFGDSVEKTKKFTYKDGEITYEFSMMGVESTVHLSKDKK